MLNCHDSRGFESAVCPEAVAAANRVAARAPAAPRTARRHILASPCAPAAASLDRKSPCRRGASAGKAVSDARAVPPPSVDVVLVPDLRVRDADDVEEKVEDLSPPFFFGHACGPENLDEIHADEEADL